jgi:hypothetical protein
MKMKIIIAPKAILLMKKYTKSEESPNTVTSNPIRNNDSMPMVLTIIIDHNP